MLDILILLNLFGFIVMFVTLYILIQLYFKMRRVYGQEEKLLSGSEDLKRELSEKIEAIAKKRVDEIFVKSGTTVDRDIKKQVEDLMAIATKKSRELSEFVTKQQEDQLKTSQFFVANMLAKIEKEAEAYRKNKMSKVDEEIRQIVLSAAREVIGRAISLSEHEDLVTKALEKAKREHIFT